MPSSRLRMLVRHKSIIRWRNPKVAWLHRPKWPRQSAKTRPKGTSGSAATGERRHESEQWKRRRDKRARKSIGVDVLVRLPLRKAALRLRAGAPAGVIRVRVTVLAQLTRTLLRRRRLDKAALIATLEGLLSRVEPNVEGRSAVLAALRWYRRGIDKQTASSPAQVS
jgi:hypothetical protein